MQSFEVTLTYQVLKMTTEKEWKNLSGNYKDFQIELDNTANGVEFINQMMKELHQIEVKYCIYRMKLSDTFRFNRITLLQIL